MQVEQIDREAAVNAVDAVVSDGFVVGCCVMDAVDGHEFAAYITEAFARHRHQARAEQAAELAKFKALAETLAGAVKALMPTHINLRMPHPDDSFIVPLDVNMGELRALDAALRKWEEARDAS